MGIKLKPSKCTSFSLAGGKPHVAPFHIGGTPVASIRDKERFLGKVIFFHGKSDETFSYIRDILKEGLDNIEKSMVRNEYKLWMYSQYFLPSKCFILTIYTLTDTQLKLLDTLTDKSVKKWAGLPPSATNAILHMKEGLNFKSISELYMESHTISHTRTRLKGDSNVNAVVNAFIARESVLTRKKSTCNEAEIEYLTGLHSNTVQDEIPEFSGERAAALKHQFDSEVNDSVKTQLKVQNRNKSETHVKKLAVQGNFLALAAAEKEDIVWKSYMFHLKQGTLKFLLNSAIDTLPTAAN